MDFKRFPGQDDVVLEVETVFLEHWLYERQVVERSSNARLVSLGEMSWEIQSLLEVHEIGGTRQLAPMRRL